MQEAKITQQPPQEALCLQSKQPSILNQKLSQLCPNQLSDFQQCARNGPICPQCSNRSQGENAAIKKQKSNIQPFTTKEVSPNQQMRKFAANQQNPMMLKQNQTIKEQRKLDQSRVNLKISNAEPILKVSQGGQNKAEFNHQIAKYGQTDIEIRFILNKPKNNIPIQTVQPVLKSSQVGENIQLLNLRQTQAQIPIVKTIQQKQQTSIRLQNSTVEIKNLNLNASQVRFRAQSQTKISQLKSSFDYKNYSNYEIDLNINHISPLPLRFQKVVEQRSQIQKLISLGNSDRNHNFNDFNLSDNMERSEVQQFHGNRLVSINEQIPKKQLIVLPEVLEAPSNQIEEKLTQKTESQSFEIKKYLQDADWLAHMGEVQEGKEAKYIITFMLQFVFIYFNLHFSLKTPKGYCMDSSHGLDFFILRPCLLGSALADAAVTIFMLLVIILYVAKAIHAQKFYMLEHLTGLVWVGKMFLWTLALTALMLQSLKGSCSADILAFGIGSIVIQTIILVILLVRKCEQPDEQDQYYEQP